MTQANPLTFWELDFSGDTELGNLQTDIETARKRLDTALFKHMAMLAPVAVGGMGMFLRGGTGSVPPQLVAMIGLPAAILVLTVMLSALSLALAPTNVVPTTDKQGNPIRLSRDDWATALRNGAVRTNWHRGYEDNVEFYGFALAALSFLLAGAWALFG